MRARPLRTPASGYRLGAHAAEGAERPAGNRPDSAPDRGLRKSVTQTSAAARMAHAKSAGMKIVPYHPQYRSDFERLNRAWLEKYFIVEQTDETIFRDLETVILEPGGEIFFAMIDGRAVGTCAMIPEGAGVYELGKMGVDPSAQGGGVGAALLGAATRWARDRAASKIVLMSNTRLEPAIRLYRRHGFLETALPAHLQGAYARCDIYMELDLSPARKYAPLTNAVSQPGS